MLSPPPCKVKSSWISEYIDGEELRREAAVTLGVRIKLVHIHRLVQVLVSQSFVGRAAACGSPAK